MCLPSASACWQRLAQDTHGCRVSCTGLYADIEVVEDAPLEHSYKENVQDKFEMLANKGNLLTHFSLNK